MPCARQRGRDVGLGRLKAMPGDLRIDPLAASELETLLPMIAGRLYDATGAERSEWIEYELGL